MYQYLGFGLLTLVAILMIPAQDIESISDTSMYGMVILTVRDSADNILLTNTVHNIVVDTGTARMLGNMFTDAGNIVGAGETAQADGICLTNATSFAVVDSIDSTNFAAAGGGGNNLLDEAVGASCKTVTWTMSNTAATGGLVNFATVTNVPVDTTITGFAVCDLAGDADSCVTTSDLVSVIATSVTLGTGETVDITYVLNLD